MISEISSFYCLSVDNCWDSTSHQQAASARTRIALGYSTRTEVGRFVTWFRYIPDFGSKGIPDFGSCPTSQPKSPEKHGFLLDFGIYLILAQKVYLILAVALSAQEQKWAGLLLDLGIYLILTQKVYLILAVALYYTRYIIVYQYYTESNALLLVCSCTWYLSTKNR